MPTSIVRLAFAALLSPLGGFVSFAAAAERTPPLDGYRDFASLQQELEALAEIEGVSLRSLCRTRGGREVLLLTLGRGKVDTRPALLVVGNVHEPHLAGSELALRLARRLAERAQQDDGPERQLLERFTVYVIPRPNPDGSERLFQPPFRERAGNDRATDDDRDFRRGEDPPDDLNGDGWITQMRVVDPSGRMMAHPEDDRLLIEADAKKNERGSYRVYSEGRDDDGDEAFNEDAGDGVSFNRNFTFRYPAFASGAGPNAVSEPESRAVADFAFDHPQIAVVFTFTPEDNLLHPWKPDAASEREPIKTRVLQADAPLLDFVARRYSEIRGGKDAPSSPPGAGSFSEWAYYHFGRWSLAARGWWPPKTEAAAAKVAETAATVGGESAAQAVDPAAKPASGAEQPSAKPPRDDRAGDQRSALAWFAAQGIEGFSPWTPVDHPDFPGKQVEVGGFQPFFLLNPPAELLDEVAGKHAEFLVELASLMPRLAIRDPRAEALGAGVFRIRFRLANDGFLPTCSEIGRRSGQVPPLQASLDLPEGAELLVGHRRQRVDRLEGSGASRELLWLVRFPGKPPQEIRLRVWSPPVGREEVMIPLPDARAK